jgi:DNA-binding transcriptional ArsR family regulator
LGLRLPNKARRDGAELRGRLIRLGVFRESGHEHLAGSLVVPLFAGGEVVGLYGRKLNDHLRVGTPSHLYLPGPHRGVWNEAGLAGGEVIVCESLIDALTFVCAGFENVTAAYGTSGFTPDHHQALAAHGVRRVLVAYDHDQAGDTAAVKLAGHLAEAGIECFRVVCPAGADVNEVACAAKTPRDALGMLIRHAEWIGPGRPPVPTPGRPAPAGPAPAELAVPVSSSAAASSPARATAPPVVSPVPVPAPVSEVDAGGDGDELRLEVGGRRWRVRGVSKAKGVDSLRVNVAVSDEVGGLHVDTVDLYSSKARGGFVREAVGELHIDEPTMKTELGRVLLAVETAATAGQAAVDETPPAMSDVERAEALALLRDPDLVGRVTADFARLGLVGEEINALVCLLAVVSRKGEKPLGILIQSSSAAGKSTLADAVLALCPPEDTVAYSAMTGQSLFYLGESDLAHKVLAIAEEEGASRASYALKLLQSEGRLSIASTGKDPVSGKLVTHTYTVRGPVALLTTTTAVDVDEELANRLIVLAVAEDPGQTRAIHHAQRHALTVDSLVARHGRQTLLDLHRNAQRLLEPLPVVVPDADSLRFPHVSTRARRDHAKYLGLICASALLHQHQRPRRTVDVADGQLTYIEAAAADIVLADRLAGDVLHRDGAELTPATGRVLDGLLGWAPTGPFTRRQARDALGAGDTQLKVHLGRLVDLEYVAVRRDGTAVFYELAVTYDDIRSGSEPVRSGPQAIRSGSGRPPVAGPSGSGRPPTDTPFPQPTAHIGDHPVGSDGNHVAGGPDLVVVIGSGGSR